MRSLAFLAAVGCATCASALNDGFDGPTALRAGARGSASMSDVFVEEMSLEMPVQTGGTGATGLPANFMADVISPRPELKSSEDYLVLAAFKVANLRLDIAKANADMIA